MARPLITIEASSGSVSADRCCSGCVCDLVLVFSGSLTWGGLPVLKRVHLASTGKHMRGGRTSMTAEEFHLQDEIRILQTFGKIRVAHLGVFL